MRLMHSAGFVDTLKYYAGAALFASFFFFLLLLWLGLHLFLFLNCNLQRIFYGAKYGSLTIKSSHPEAGGQERRDIK